MDDEAGFALIERAMLLDEDATISGCEVLRDYCRRHGREEQANAWNRRLAESAENKRIADKERNELLLEDQFKPHGMTAVEVAQLRTELKSVPGLRKAYFVQKRLQTLGPPLYVLGYTVGARFGLFTSKRKAAIVMMRVKEAVSFPGETILVNIERGNARFERKFMGVDDSRIV